ncbi:MAG: SRPBCC family protein [Chloroflexi bacterium]|nr:SRPBCC family protein [Chloroflexota bacterium]
MTKVSAEIVIDAPAERVWEVLADFGSVYKWAPGVTESHSTSSSNSGADAARHCEVPGFGGIEEFVTEWSEGVGFSYRVDPVGLISGATSTWKITPQGDKTLVYTELNLKMRFGVFGLLMEKLVVKRKIEKGTRNGLEGLKQHVMTGELIGTDFRAPIAA